MDGCPRSSIVFVDILAPFFFFFSSKSFESCEPHRHNLERYPSLQDPIDPARDMASSLLIRSVLLLLALLVLLTCKALASFRVITVGDAASATEIEHQLALFGRPKFGSGLVAALALAPDTNRDACQALDQLTLQSALASAGITTSPGTDGDDSEPFALLVARGQCHFVNKARHAQAAGAAAVVVYDTGDDSAKLPVLADDGTGGDIRIPSLLIHHKDAQGLITQLEHQVKTIVAIRWDVPHPDDRVEVSLWFSSRSSPSLQEFIANFRTVIQALGQSVLFTPQYDIHVGSAWGCARENGDGAGPTHCPDLCAYHEQFCTYDPERNNTIGLDGKDVVEETVRQLCVYEHVQTTTNSSVLYWDYLARFNTNCSAPEATSKQFNKACSEAVQRELGLPESVAACAESEATATRLLQKQVDALREFHVIDFPEWSVNGIPMFGSITCDSPISLATCTPLHMICAGFADGRQPAACHDAYWTSEPTTCIAPLLKDECGVCNLLGSPLWNFHCAGCDDIPHSAKRFDACRVCGGDGSIDLCGQCLPANDARRDKSCMDCRGVPFGLTERDACGVCGGHGSFDACGLCLDAKDPRRQNFVCHVMDDPDAVTAKVEIQGLDMKQFHGDMLMGFQEAVGFLSGMRPDQVLVKNVNNVIGNEPSVVVLFFVACETDTCRDQVVKKLRDPSAGLAIAMKMKSSLEEKAYGLEHSKLIEHVSLHAVNGGLGVRSSVALAGMGDDTHESPVWLGAVLACALTLTAGAILLRVRDNRMRRDFQELFARYTPLTAMEDNSDDEAGRRDSGDADAW
jgi:hypothetical protein